MWTAVVRSRVFQLKWRKRTKRRAHINVSELSAALRSEARRARRCPNRRWLLGSDSQVTLGALIKGRSASRCLNACLKRSLPTLLAYNAYTALQYIPTGDNVADDPTRDAVCRSPPIVEPPWLAAVKEEDYRGLDEVLRAHGVDDAAVPIDQLS